MTFGVFTVGVVSGRAGRVAVCNNLLKIKNETDALFLLAIKNQNHDVTRRWELYTYFVNNSLFYKCDSSYITIPTIEKKPGFKSYYDDFYIDRYQTVNLVDLVEQIEEARRQYYLLDSPTISDDEYDKAFRELEKLEEEAYLRGNMIFRKWEDSQKNKK